MLPCGFEYTVKSARNIPILRKGVNYRIQSLPRNQHTYCDDANELLIIPDNQLLHISQTQQ